MTTLLQVSDPHFGTEQPEVVDGLLRLARVLAPDVMVLSGDVTQRARRAQFGAARRFVDAARRRPPPQPPAALLAVPGNHDIPLFNLAARALWPYAGFRACFGARLEPQWDGPALQLTLLDSTRRWRHKNGQLSAAQIERTAARLRQAAPEQLRVVVVHHPLAVPREGERHNLLRGHADALRCWAGAGADLVLGGHIHLPCLLPVNGGVPGMWVLQAGTAVSSRTRHDAGNSVNVVRVAAGSTQGGRRLCHAERWDWQPQRGEFACVSQHELVCGVR